MESRRPSGLSAGQSQSSRAKNRLRGVPPCRAAPPVAGARRRRGACSCSAGCSVGVVLVDHGSRKAESNQMLAQLVEVYKQHTGRSNVQLAHMELAAPTIGDAFDACVAEGATTVVVSPYFLSPGRHWQEDLPALASAAAARHPGVSYLVSAPLGLHPLVAQVLEQRVQHCLAHAAGRAPPCEVCTLANVACTLKSSTSASG